MKKILVTDFDDTLYLTEKGLRDNVKRINEFRKKGNIFIIATGRNYPDISVAVEKYKIPCDYLICNDGGTIFHNNKLIKRNDISLETANEIMKYLDKCGLVDTTYIDTGFDYQKQTDNQVNGIIIKSINRDKSKELLNIIEESFNNIHGYISNNWINLTDISVSKEAGIKYVIELEKVLKEDIYTIGNTINDISMIKAFNGSGMKNSTEDLKSHCKMLFNTVLEYIDYIEKN